MSSCDHQQLRGIQALRNPWINRGVAYSAEERERLGLHGLLPPGVSTREQQLERWKKVVDMQTTPLAKYLALDSLRQIDEALFFQMVATYVDEFMPIVYTPTVGEACQKFGQLFRAPRGLYICHEDKGHIRQILDNVPNERVDIIVMTDGSRILGLGDLGAGGMGIPIGKLALYTVCAGVNPKRALPVTIDVGTNNETLLNDPLYLGQRHKRIGDDEYFPLIEEFIMAARDKWPGVFIHFEDFQNARAFALLDKWRGRVPCFNDDIEGTAAVVVTGFYSAARALRRSLSEERVLFLGAGSAALGIAGLLVDALVDAGLSQEEARRHISLFDSKGLVCSGRTDPMSASKRVYAHDWAPTDCFLEAIRQIKPTAIVGVSAQAGAFSREVIGLMSEINERPIIFALSNPTSKAECTAEQAYEFSNGKCLFACGSPFAPVTLNGQTFVPRQGNNSYVFPGIGLGCIVSRTNDVDTGVFLAAAKCLANMISAEDLAQGSLYPPLSLVREISAKIAIAVARHCYDRGLADGPAPADLEELVRQAMWDPAAPCCCGRD